MNIRRAPRVAHPPVTEDEDDDFGWATVSLVIGIVGLCLLTFYGPLGLATGTVGTILGLKSLRSRRKGLAIAGIVLSVVSFIAAIALLIWV